MKPYPDRVLLILTFTEKLLNIMKCYILNIKAFSEFCIVVCKLPTEGFFLVEMSAGMIRKNEIKERLLATNLRYLSDTVCFAMSCST